ncbi:thioredoxin TrxC [Psychromonas antarctica]|uniref:thioredoxin TrxC n=1 Tax=Psychromonas antarctica TaxID=67573 RepID=UPI001EE7A723|nr:thioredoxin TrxC [Psychromonas antarctica]MCG6201078.1 thioredoxin TrxC [Psychromonas antarctica]
MSSFKTSCPSCSAMNRVPQDKVTDSATCGKCKASLFDGAPIEGTDNNLDPILFSDKPVVIDFWAPWCKPCVGFAPVFKEVAKQRKGTVRFVKIDTEANQSLAGEYQIRSIPTIMVFKNGQRVDMLSGALSKTQFNGWLDKALNK